LVGIGTREGYSGRWVAISVASDLDLGARGIEFGPTHASREMQSNNLMSDQVSAGSEVLREYDVESVPLHDISLIPGTGVLFANLINLEPLGTGRVELVAGRGTTGSHIGHQRSSIVRPILSSSSRPLESNGTAWVGRDDHLSILSAQAADEVGVARAFDGANIINESNGTWSLVVVRHIPRIERSVNSDLTKKTMGVDGRKGRQERSTDSRESLHSV